MANYDRKNLSNRRERNRMHNERALKENSRNITQHQFIKALQVFYFSGSIDKPHSEYIVHFKLNNPILIKDFERAIKEKMKGAIVE